MPNSAPSTAELFGGKLTIPEILDDDHIYAAAELLSAYYRESAAGILAYTGSLFNCWAGGGDARPDANRVTAAYLVAVSFLSVKIPARAAIGILDTHATTISDLLVKIPADLDMAEVSGDDFAKYLDDDSPADKLWRLLRRKNDRWDMGRTRTSKLIARKRPKLIPIYDSIVGPLMGLDNGSKGQWKRWHAALTEGTGLPERLQEIRRISGVADPISDIRVMDIVLWMYGKQNPAS